MHRMESFVFSLIESNRLFYNENFVRTTSYENKYESAFIFFEIDGEKFVECQLLFQSFKM